MTAPPLRETKEWAWLALTLLLCSVLAIWLVITIPIVNKLPEGTSTVAEYVVNATIARFGLPVAGFLLLASLVTALGHNRGDGRWELDFAGKVFSFAAATFSFWAVTTGLWVLAHFPG